MKDIKELYLTWKRENTETSRSLLFQEIWQTYHKKLQVYLLQFSQTDIEITDRVSEILLKVFESIETYNSSYAFSTWIYRVARNNQIDILRKKKIQYEKFDTSILPDPVTPETITQKDSEKHVIRDAVSKLSSIDREMIYLHFYENLPFREISKIVKIPVGTIKYRMAESRKRLKVELKRSLML